MYCMNLNNLLINSPGRFVFNHRRLFQRARDKSNRFEVRKTVKFSIVISFKISENAIHSYEIKP